MTLRELTEQYRPYNGMIQFKEGFVDYLIGNGSPYPSGLVVAQAWDRGAEAAMRWERLQREG